jgi:hypothetical protein
MVMAVPTNTLLLKVAAVPVIMLSVDATPVRFVPSPTNEVAVITPIAVIPPPTTTIPCLAVMIPTESTF